ncbi:CpsD/CapB family tyrosine-protein kinase [Paenibacillus validus]|uniref:CpsD/CapB family tyrosine-protein kinase n=1 Tax=Paenibacillus TaxID=44249 RepID=UPI000FD802D2|nr:MULTISPECIES: CpsD/CapB family tyrosine-protein kinase [Paenibacillus]MED4600749.1 CpsD/CapB family tyrosine-protein kinase [Paenibacillus validus]MED4606180.1 CpsD/CapB family tyrosine-protein kinase [Paenibacillus validus]
MLPSTNNRRPIITHENPKSPISEAYRTLRTNIQFSAIDEELRVIMATSAGPGEGKSTTLTNLAVAYAQADMRVVLIDADLRKPTMHHTFSLSNRMGLTSVLSGQAELDEVVRESYIPNLNLITSGPIPPNPSEMLASKRMTKLLDDLKERFDVILIDAPPILAVTDSQIVATKSDGVILVIDSGKVKRDMAIKAKANLEHVNARILGVVLNNMDRKNAESYYYYYYGAPESKN